MGSIDRNRRLNAAEIRDGKVVLESRPLQINFELIGYCNIVPPCLYCSGKNFGYNYAALDPAYLDEYADFITVAEHLNEDSFGEPLMHKQLTKIAADATGRGQRFSFVTNGLLLSGERAQQLAECGPLLGFHVSLNAAAADTYYKLHGKPFDRVVENVRSYVALYKEWNGDMRPDLIMTFIVMRMNRHEVFDFLRLTRDLGVRGLLAQLHARPSVPLGNFGYDFVYENEMLSPGEYFELGAEVQSFVRGEGMSGEVVIQWDPDHDSAVRALQAQQNSERDERAEAERKARRISSAQPWNYAPEHIRTEPVRLRR